MNQADQVIASACQNNPIKGLILATILDGGRLVATGEKVADLLALTPECLSFERRDLQALAGFADFSSKDLIFVESLNIDTLWNLAHETGAQVALLSDSFSEESLVDVIFSEGDLRSALIQIQKDIEALQALKGQVHMEGSLLNKALFLDRDGVVIEDTGYINDASKVELRPGVVKALKSARQKGYKIILVSNQSGIGRGLVSWAQYEQVTERMQNLLAEQGVYFDRILRAPFYEKSTFASGLIRRSLRKPRPGMIHLALREFRIDVSQSLMVGDKATDLMMAAVCGIRRLCLMHSEHFTEELKSWKTWPLISRLPKTQLEEIKSLDEIF